MNAAGANTRTLAAQALQRVVAGASLRVELETTAARLDDSRDRAFLSALLHAGARWWLRYEAGVARLLQRPLPPREAALRALLVLGVVQIEVLRMPGYAVVDASVEAARALAKPAFAALVNAILRRWLRERDALNAALDRDAVTRTAHPRWLLEALAADWGERSDAIVAANNTEAPLWLRVNRRRAAPADVVGQLAQRGIEADTSAALADALLLAGSTDVTRLPGFAAGLFSVQDGAAQFAADVLAARDGERVLDACAAPGGKAAHILERAGVRLLALDRDERRLPRIGANLSRLGLAAEVRCGDAGEPQAWWDGVPFDRILLDAPCSATGIIRRQSDVKLHRRAADLPELMRGQARLLDALWPLLAPGGRLVYATCSVLKAENAAQIEDFRARHRDALAGTGLPAGWHAAGAGAAQNLPGESGMDGFFYAVLEKSR